MNSLRTDDIFGAMPRVRHMPKNLIRERSQPPNFTPLRPYSYLQPSNMRVSVNYQNNEPNNYPFYERNRLSKEPRYVSYEAFQVDHPRGSSQENIDLRRKADRINQSVVDYNKRDPRDQPSRGERVSNNPEKPTSSRSVEQF